MGLAVIVALLPIVSNGNPQILMQVFSHHPNGQAWVTPGRFAWRGVAWQDKARGESARRGTRPPAADEPATRAQPDRGTTKHDNAQPTKTA
jgi:hypothetical protein